MAELQGDIDTINTTITNIPGNLTIWVLAAAMTPQFTNGASVGIAETATNDVMLHTLDFDTATVECAQFAVRMPKSWNEGTVTFGPTWSHAATTTNFGVTWSLTATAFSNDDALDVLFTGGQNSVDTGGTTNDIYKGPTSAAITVQGTAAENDLVIFRIARAVADAGDTMAIDARLHGVTIFYTTNAVNDA